MVGFPPFRGFEKASPVDAAYLDLDGWGAFRSSYAATIEAESGLPSTADSAVTVLGAGALILSDSGETDRSAANIYSLRCCSNFLSFSFSANKTNKK